MAFSQLLKSNGSWADLKSAWEVQCSQAGEDFEQYARGSFIVFEELADAPQKAAGIFGLTGKDGSIDVVCQVNVTPLPGHPEPVLRVRYVTVSPAIDFGAMDKGRYADALADLFFEIVELSELDSWNAKEFKLHLRSPGDYDFFRVAARLLKSHEQFAKVEMHGAWLHVTKSP